MPGGGLSGVVAVRSREEAVCVGAAGKGLHVHSWHTACGFDGLAANAHSGTAA
jgi:hypothetical protein